MAGVSSRAVRAAVFGTGKVGKEIVQACLDRRDLDLVAAVVVDPEKAGRDVGRLVGRGEVDVQTSLDADAVLARADVDVVFYCGLGDPLQVSAFLGRCADYGKDAITVTGLVHPWVALGPAADELAERALRGGARLVGTGVNPGFLLDVLPALWGTMLVRVDTVHALRVSEIREWGQGIHRELGIGLPATEARALKALSLDESLGLVVDSLRLDVDATEDLHEPMLAPSRRVHRGRAVEAGTTIGFRRRSLARRDGAVVVELEWIGLFCLDPAVDGVTECARIRLVGDSTVEAEATGSFFGDAYPSTAARAVNAVLPLRRLPPGLYRPDQLPIGG